MNTLGYAILGLLARQPQSGYDLTQAMKRTIAFFWQAHHSTIYPELRRLERQGLVAYEVVEQQERPDKKVYTLTAAGREALRRWVAEPTPLPADRDELMVKVFSVWAADPAATAAMIRAREREHRRRLADYERLRAEMEAEAGAEELSRVDSPRFASYATLRRGIEYERGYADWCAWMAATLERGHIEEE